MHWTDTYDLEHPNEGFPRLLEVRNHRTLSYCLSWAIDQVASLLLGCGVLVHLPGW
ncbi:hypothetical protein ACFYW9_01775 [Streptomyces sp. NPDC002698]|uniref:hypothetical protein n=1 Tax=Streptomyces sp. NPDC002698 TaxID=3364660 RepID=UPI0036B14248